MAYTLTIPTFKEALNKKGDKKKSKLLDAVS